MRKLYALMMVAVLFGVLGCDNQPAPTTETVEPAAADKEKLMKQYAPGGTGPTAPAGTPAPEAGK